MPTFMSASLERQADAAENSRALALSDRSGLKNYPCTLFKLARGWPRGRITLADAFTGANLEQPGSPRVWNHELGHMLCSFQPR